MTVQEIIEYASKQLLNKNVPMVDGIAWINDALLILGIDAGVFDEAEYTAVSGMWQGLPEDCLKVYEVRDSKDYDYNNFDADTLRIRFWDTGTYTVRYYKRPEPVEDESSEPDCRKDLHNALAYYIAYRWWKRNFPGEQATQSWYDEYLTRVMQATNKQKKQTEVKVIR